MEDPKSHNFIMVYIYINACAYIHTVAELPPHAPHANPLSSSLKFLEKVCFPLVGLRLRRLEICCLCGMLGVLPWVCSSGSSRKPYAPGPGMHTQALLNKVSNLEGNWPPALWLGELLTLKECRGAQEAAEVSFGAHRPLSTLL